MIAEGQRDLLRIERDRFVALAFCTADVLVELDAELGVVFVAGMTESVFGQPPAALTGRSFIDLVAPGDRLLVREVLRQAVSGRRLDPIVIRLSNGNVDLPAAGLVGYQLAELDNHYFLALGKGASREEDAERVLGRDESTGLLDRESITERIVKRVKSGGPEGNDLRMSLVEIAGLDELENRLDEKSQAEFAASLGAYLRAASVAGDTAGRLDDAHFAILHVPQTDMDGLASRVGDFSREIDPEGRGVTATATSVAVDVGALSEDDILKAVALTINQFCDSMGDDRTVKSLSTMLGTMVQATLEKVSALRSVIDRRAFDIVFQPIVDLVTRVPHHYEALVRFNDGSRVAQAYEFINFAEETGVICDFDLAMCRRALEWFGEAPGRSTVVLAVNLSGLSLAKSSFVVALHDLLRKHPASKRIMFELTETARIHDLNLVNRVIKGLRASGHKVCLDDFGAGAAAFQYLNALDVDVVKIDGAYVRGARASQRGRAFLKAMAGLCSDLGIATVGEMVEDEASLKILRECGLQYGQGYLFGRPAPDIVEFEAARRPARRDAR
ncbi:MAG: EAL domain-containing protein [Alphaproteobacteria bacterium]